MSTRTIIVTGGNTGLGLETAKAVAAAPDTTAVIACRNAALGQQAVQTLERDGYRATYLPLDLGDQASVRRFAELFRTAGLPPLQGIICNAGMQNVAAPKTTAEGFETTFAVNHLGHYLLVRLLLDQCAPGATITMISSGTHDPAQKTGVPPPVYTDAQALAHDLEPGRNAGLRRYTGSKLCNILFAYELSHRLHASGDTRLNTIKVNAINPGIMLQTGLARSWPKPMQWVARNIMPVLSLVKNDMQSARASATRVAALATGSDAAPGGRYFANGAPIRSSGQSYDRALQRELWIASAGMTGLPIDPDEAGAGAPKTPQPSP